MASGGASIEFSGPLSGNISTLEAKHKAAMVATGKMIESEGIAHMRTHAPWTDRTGNARNGLQGDTTVGALDVTVVFYHSVPYGIYLETRWSGRYQIILPTIQIMSRRWFGLLRGALFA